MSLYFETKISVYRKPFDRLRTSDAINTVEVYNISEVACHEQVNEGTEETRRTEPRPLVATSSMAERGGFEPPVPLWGTHDFQSCTIGQLCHLSV